MSDVIQEVVKALEHAPVEQEPQTNPAQPVPQTDQNVLAAQSEQSVDKFESILTGLLLKLEGAIHMSKPEILAVIDEARALVQKL